MEKHKILCEIFPQISEIYNYKIIWLDVLHEWLMYFYVAKQLYNEKSVWVLGIKLNF